MKILITILSLIITLTALNFITVKQTTHTVPVSSIQEVKVGHANILINDQTKHVTYSNGSNTLAFIHDRDYTHVTIQESKNLLGKTKYHVTKLTKQPIKESYVITKVSNNEYYGQSTTDNTGIYFTSDYIKSGSVQPGDTITAHFANKLDDSLLYIKKGDS